MQEISQYAPAKSMGLDMALHEIRNPFTLIYSTLQLIEAQHPEVSDFKYWKELLEDVEYTKLLLRDLSSYNKCASLNCQIIRSHDFFKSAALTFAASLSESPVEFISRVSPSLPDITGDIVKLKQALFNLFYNAKEALADIPYARISFEALETKNGILLRIRDNGCGISHEQLDHIFEPFVTYKQNGTGLGLAIAKQIIDAHNGTIQAASAPNIGTVFSVILPVKTDCQHKSGT